MEISAQDWDEYVGRLGRLSATAKKKVVDYVQKNGLDDIKALIDYSYLVATKYGEGSAALAAAMYDAIAELSGKYFPPAEVAATATYGEVAKGIRGVLKRSVSEEMLGAEVSRLVKMAAADTTLKNAQRDGGQFAWIPRGDTCAYCITLAANGWRKLTDDAFSNGHAEHIHSNCDCNYAVRFNKVLDYPFYNPTGYKGIYDNAPGRGHEKINAIRRMQYQENKDEINAQKRAAYEKRTEIQHNNPGV